MLRLKTLELADDREVGQQNDFMRALNDLNTSAQLEELKKYSESNSGGADGDFTDAFSSSNGLLAGGEAQHDIGAIHCTKRHA